jgi:hypothetical protein
MTDEIEDAIDTAAIHARQAQERLVETPIESPEIVEEANAVKHRAEDLGELAQDAVRRAGGDVTDRIISIPTDFRLGEENARTIVGAIHRAGLEVVPKSMLDAAVELNNAAARGDDLQQHLEKLSAELVAHFAED